MTTSDVPSHTEQNVTIIFDIDNVLTHISQPRNACIDKIIKISVSANGTDYYLFPGIVELLQWLYKKPYIHIAFFSAGASERNSEFIGKLLKLVFMEDPLRYKSVLASTIILSDKHLSPRVEDSSEYKRHGISSGASVKDIEKILCSIPGSDLKRCLFIDDAMSYVKIKHIRQPQ